MADVNSIVQTFVAQYYQQFDTDRSTLHCFYTDQSSLFFENSVSKGPEDIAKKFNSLPFKVVQHAISTITSNLTIDGGLLVMVIGQLKTDDDPPHGFSQVFYLKQIGTSLFILDDMFRLNLHHQ